jgi:hypothetical protein
MDDLNDAVQEDPDLAWQAIKVVVGRVKSRPHEMSWWRFLPLSKLRISPPASARRSSASHFAVVCASTFGPTIF